MPVFDYKCEQCNHLEEDVLNASNEYRCEKCGGFMERQFPHSNFYLKGEGWSNTQYAKHAKQTPPPAESD